MYHHSIPCVSLSSTNCCNRDGNLRNVEDKESINSQCALKPHKVYQGGYWQDLHRLLSVSYGDRILYIGDHMYADILRSKRTLGWRTCLIIPELDHELAVAKREEERFREVLKLRQLQYDLDEYIDTLRLKTSASNSQEEKSVSERQLKEAELKAEEIKSQVRDATEKYNKQ